MLCGLVIDYFITNYKDILIDTIEPSYLSENILIMCDSCILNTSDILIENTTYTAILSFILDYPIDEYIEERAICRDNVSDNDNDIDDDYDDESDNIIYINANDICDDMYIDPRIEYVIGKAPIHP